MDPELKQRLVGTVVITALAAIFVPMLFEEPVADSGKKISALKIPIPPVHSNSAELRPLPKNIDEVINLPEPIAIKAEASSSMVNQNTEKMQRWFVQVGIFELETNAIALKNTIIKQGFPVIMTPEDTENGLMYRVRVGPELDKKRAEAMKLKIEKLNGLKGILAIVDE